MISLPVDVTLSSTQALHYPASAWHPSLTYKAFTDRITDAQYPYTPFAFLSSWYIFYSSTCEFIHSSIHKGVPVWCWELGICWWMGSAWKITSETTYRNRQLLQTYAFLHNFHQLTSYPSFPNVTYSLKFFLNSSLRCDVSYLLCVSLLTFHSYHLLCDRCQTKCYRQVTRINFQNNTMRYIVS